ncbi:CAP domain-containing protein [Nocardiopsis halotolerans]|uniref:CAP domain-containing protein n=1 Tax=Nocardiopsis halotolerans TaxID=124252 RepID=UPI00034CA0C3|nr:CAP domain-containing protein [Nocardiopsis halotolerans]
MARGRRGRRRKSAREHRRDGRQRRAVPLAVPLAAVPVGLVLAGGLLATGVGPDIGLFQNTAGDRVQTGEIGDAVTDTPPAPEASGDDDFFASPSTTPEREPTPSEGTEPQSAEASSGPEAPEASGDEETGDDTTGNSGGGGDSGTGDAGGGTGSGGGAGNGNGGNGNGGGGDRDEGGEGSPASGAVTDQVVTLVNDERAEAGCDPLRVDQRLTAAAQEHSEDMNRRDYMAHVSPEGEGPGDRARQHGYHAWGAENVAMGQTSAEQVMEAWMNSDGHRRNILDCGLVAIGVGESGNAWTQMFGWE